MTESPPSFLFDAIEFAVRAHAGQFRKGTRVPYILHPLAVAKILIESGCRDTVVAAGILHDVVEDTTVTLRDIRALFGAEVGRLVEALTEPPKSEPWETRKRHTLHVLEHAPLEVVMIGCADKLDNLRSLQADLQREGDAVWKRFNRGRAQQQWYYEELARVFSQRLTDKAAAELAREFQERVRAVFAE